MARDLFSLTAWERRSEWNSNIQLGNDTRTQVALLRQQTEAMVAANQSIASEIITSRARIGEGIDRVSYQLDDIKDGMDGLRAAFEFGISEVVWQIEQTRRVLTNILEVLMAPLDTQAKELRRRAEEAYAHGWFDDALADLLESEQKNRYDFAVHITIGMIYLFQKVDRPKAQDYFRKAVKYAQPKSPYHASLALLHLAVIKRDLGEIEEAERLTDQAVTLSPEFAEAHYQNALYNALLKKLDKSIARLRRAIKFDVNYCDKATADDAFAGIRPQVQQLFEQLREEQRNVVRGEYQKVRPKYEQLTRVCKEVGQNGVCVPSFTQERQCFERVDELIRRHSYRDYLEATNRLSQLESFHKERCAEVCSRIGVEINKHLSDVSGQESARQSLDARVRDWEGKWLAWGYCSLIPALSAFFAGLVAPPSEKWSVAAALGFAVASAIPVIGHGHVLLGFVCLLSGMTEQWARFESAVAVASIFVAVAYIGGFKVAGALMRQRRKAIVTDAEATCQRRVTWLRHMTSLAQMSPAESEPVVAATVGLEMQYGAGQRDAGWNNLRQQGRGLIETVLSSASRFNANLKQRLGEENNIMYIFILICLYGALPVVFLMLVMLGIAKMF